MAACLGPFGICLLLYQNSVLQAAVPGVPFFRSNLTLVSPFLWCLGMRSPFDLIKPLQGISDRTDENVQGQTATQWLFQKENFLYFLHKFLPD